MGAFSVKIGPDIFIDQKGKYGKIYHKFVGHRLRKITIYKQQITNNEQYTANKP